MHISGFLLLGIFLLILLWAFAVAERTNFFHHNSYNALNTKEPKALWIRGVYILLFAIMAFAAVSTMKSYIYPTDESVYKNVDYHVLSHKGYEVGEEFYLANGYTSNGNGTPTKSLWDNKDGKVLLDRADNCFRITEFTEPLYMREDTENSKLEFWKDDVTRVYKLVNQVIKTDVSNGFVLTLDNDTLYKLKIALDKEEKFMYISTVYKNGKAVTDTSKFRKTITQGYPLLDIIAKTPGIEVTEQMEEWFDGAMLVRSEIPMDGNVPAKFDIDNPAPLCFMPGLLFYMNDGLKVNGESFDFKQEFTIPFKEYAYNDKVTFFSGIGNKKSEEFRLSCLDDNRMRLEFLKPDMKHIKDTLGRVFINSSIEYVAKESLTGGYLYNKFVDESNVNHISAHFMYGVGNARNELSINIVDLNFNSRETEDSIRVYKCDNEFLLKTRDNSVSWIFEVTNLRDTNDLTANMITLFIIVMFAMVAVRILSDSLLGRNTLSITELAIYVIMLSLCVVRLILGWRASTFIPVEDITLPMYLKMRVSIFEWVTWLAALLPLAVAIGVELWKLCEGKIAGLKAFGERFTAKPWNSVFVIVSVVAMCVVLHNIIPLLAVLCFAVWKLCEGKVALMQVSNNNVVSKPLITFVIFFAVLAMCFVLRNISVLNRLCNISIPIIVYLVFEIRINQLKENSVGYTTFWRIFAFFMLFGYLFIADAGFTIIFLAYMMIHYLVLEKLFKNAGNRRLRGIHKYAGHIWSVSFLLALFFILSFEGDIMIGVFKHAGIVMSVIMGVALVSSGYFFYSKKVWVSEKLLNKLLRPATVVLLSVGFVVCMLDAFKVMESVTPFLNDKAHMRYRAEIQSLSAEKNEKIDDLISGCNFESDDIEYIMRSAHNQWFINQYIRAGQRMEENDEYFHIQPHSNQGATYITQTTDLVVTRYLLAEHGEQPVRRILFMWTMLILIFLFEFRMKERMNRMFLGSPILIYVVSMMVYLSATNRIVFVGQDFPLISLQSRVAILFPILLFALLLGRCIYVRSKDSNRDSGDTAEYILNGTIFAAFLILFTFGCMNGIEQKGKDQQETQFNVSRLVSDLSARVDRINDSFKKFQSNNESTLKKYTVEEVWRMFIGNGVDEKKYNKVYYDAIESKEEEDKFFASLLKYFNENTKTQTDANQLLHLRRRSGKCYLALNKQHYFIPAIMREEYRWRGDIYASKVEPEIKLVGNDGKTISSNSIPDSAKYKKNILSGNVVESLPNMPLMCFGKEWTPGDKPLYLIASKVGNQFIAYFEIESDSIVVEGSDKGQIATAILPGDLLRLKKVAGGKILNLLNGQMTNDGTPYIVRSMWLNGHRQLFYPLGKEFMWTYHFGNMVSDVFSKDPVYKDTSLYLSIDYDLHKALYADVCEQAKNKRFDFTAVAIDGDGQIRALFDYSHKRNIDPNNATHLNKVISDLYRDGSNSDERDIFGSKALQHMTGGPGSSLKPIAYTAISSQKRLEWERINIATDGKLDKQKVVRSATLLPKDKKQPGEDDDQYLCYGGAKFGMDSVMTIDGGVVRNQDYLVQSNNLFHSIIIMLGMQTSRGADSIMMPYDSSMKPEDAFPVFDYKGENVCFNRDKWYGENGSELVKRGDMFTQGMFNNYHITYEPTKFAQSYTGLFGNNEKIKKLYEKGGASRGWVFPEWSSLNNADRLDKGLRGFNQTLLGSDPLKFTPLQMAINALRLASLNRSESIVSLIDGDVNRNYKFFNLGDGWGKDMDKDRDKQEYLDFMKEHVWKQLREVPKSDDGTAKQLRGLANNMESGKYGKPYYLYCKTGTLSDSRDGSGANDKLKHLLVIITDSPLEKVENENALKKVRSYVLYLSYFGINKSDFNNGLFQDYIEDVLNSNSFKKYMNK